MEPIGFTGASGFIGNHVARYFTCKGRKIIAFGRDSSKNFNNQNVEWKVIDLNYCKPQDFEGIDKLIHFAGSYLAEDAFGKNIDMLNKVLKSVSENRSIQIYLISTYAVFGNRETPASPEETHAPLENYALSKSLAEGEFNKFLASTNMKGTIIRPCSLYGEYGKNFVDVIADVIKREGKIEMVKFRNQFLHVLDFCKALDEVTSIENPSKSYNIEGEIITEEILKEIFDQLSVDYTLHDKKVRSYWCTGFAVDRDFSVKEYLTNAKLKSPLSN